MRRRHSTEGRVDFRGAGHPKVPVFCGTFPSWRLRSPWGPGRDAQSNSCFLARGIRVPSKPRQASLFYIGEPFSVFSLQFCGPTLSQAKIPKELRAGCGNAGAGDCQSPDSAPVNPVPLQLAFLCHPVNFPSFSVLPSCCQALQLCRCLWLLLPCSEGTKGLTFADQPAGDRLQKSSHQGCSAAPRLSVNPALCNNLPAGLWQRHLAAAASKVAFLSHLPCLLAGGGALCHADGLPNTRPP